MSSNLYLDNLESWICEDRKIVTYKWLSHELKVASDTAKKMLFAFAQKMGKKVKVIYFVGGKKEGRDEFTLVRDHLLDECRSEFDQVTGVHVYSVQTSFPNDAIQLWNADAVQYQSALQSGEASDYLDNRYGGISFDLERRSGRERFQVQHLASKGFVDTSKVKLEHQNNVKTALPPSVTTAASTAATSTAGGKGKGTMASFFKPAAEKPKAAEAKPANEKASPVVLTPIKKEREEEVSESPEKDSDTDKKSMFPVRKSKSPQEVKTAKKRSAAAVKAVKKEEKKEEEKKGKKDEKAKKKKEGSDEEGFSTPIKASSSNRKRRIVDSPEEQQQVESDSTSDSDEEEAQPQPHSQSSQNESPEKKPARKRQRSSKPKQSNTLDSVLSSPPKKPAATEKIVFAEDGTKMIKRMQKRIVTEKYKNEKGYTVTRDVEIEEEVEVPYSASPVKEEPKLEAAAPPPPKAAQSSIRNFFSVKK